MILETQASPDCKAAATEQLATLLASAGCTQVVRATMKSPNQEYLITAGIFNLTTEKAATQRLRRGQAHRRRAEGPVRRHERRRRHRHRRAGPRAHPARLELRGPLPRVLRDRPRRRQGVRGRRPVPEPDHVRHRRDLSGERHHREPRRSSSRSPPRRASAPSPPDACARPGVADSVLDRRGGGGSARPGRAAPSASSGYRTATRVSPCGGATVDLAGPLRAGQQAGRPVRPAAGRRRPASSAPTRLRTIAWQNASACTVATSDAVGVAAPVAAR